MVYGFWNRVHTHTSQKPRATADTTQRHEIYCRWFPGRNIWSMKGSKQVSQVVTHDLLQRDSAPPPTRSMWWVPVKGPPLLHPGPNTHLVPDHPSRLLIHSYYLNTFLFPPLFQQLYMEMKMIKCFSHNRCQLYKPYLLEIDLPFFFGNSLFFNFALPHPQKVSCWWSPAALFLNMPQGSSRHDFICFLWVTKWQGKELNRSWPLTADLNSFNLKM